MKSNRGNRFFKEVKAYNKKLIGWLKDYKIAINGLVVKLKEEAKLAKLK
jgi:hypothetical protein